MRICAKEAVIVIETTKTVIATPTIPTPSSYTSLSEFKNTVLKVSNKYRNVHDADGLVWNETLVKYAKEWAETCIWKHSVGLLYFSSNLNRSRQPLLTPLRIQDGPYGENLAFGYSNASAAVKAWGDEGELYNFYKPTGFTEQTGHFTQLVWKETMQVGCAAVNCGYTDKTLAERDENEDKGKDVLVTRAPDGSERAQGWYVVCEYTPAGNVVGGENKYFKLNVSPKKYSDTTTESRGSTAILHSGVSLMLLAFGVVGVSMGLYT
ncbi:hypothetical protein N7495_007650 [Penicillium taxi]|uniref:uncharacterized protein n=1 Tax=Penicillium taxi TaxID=168475 RepID=UPI0025453207|nr:uncharacterized protein N7495_007650 [Penicillium taxi]KAJ5887609.1 hypothetical protein N7495_007650 [Penicillium taxi]